MHKVQAKACRPNRPRHLLNRSPFGGANVYPFTCSVTQYDPRAWDAPDDHALFNLNVDSTYYIMKTEMQLPKLPDYEEFQNLFTQYKMISWETTITPTFKATQFGSTTRGQLASLELVFFTCVTSQTVFIH